MPSTHVSTSATTTAMPRPASTTSHVQVVYETTPGNSHATTYTVEPHPPTPRDGDR